MNYVIDGDTNFMGIVNADRYTSFVDSDWDLDMLRQHVAEEMKKGNVIVWQLTSEGVEVDWRVNVGIGQDPETDGGYRESESYICVTNNELHIVNYDCLTMSAQFQDHLLPDEDCKIWRIQLDNGIYKVRIIQFYNVDQNEHLGKTDVDLRIEFQTAAEFKSLHNDFIWADL
ncbi:hypothetical protein MNQ98_22210 [Paenibacillus sp. N3/727]|uniref:hypothetical protein n=1 Tax=Paenibacillus sp. N3/727 TaxID=2925845 RepID=UPI001F537E25|nr:hypothetical protein [Paenibacillus sp. N3/727]UNK17171.1 hypothetical protein MNQ98_22210 [Paenibacillus sp. N3/727]